MKRAGIKAMALIYGLIYGNFSVAGDASYLCKAISAYEVDSSGKLVPEKNMWAPALGKTGIPFSINRDSGEMIGSGFDTGGGWSVKVLNHGRRIKDETANSHAIVTSATWAETNYQVHNMHSVFVNEASPSDIKPFVIHDGAVIITGFCK